MFQAPVFARSKVGPAAKPDVADANAVAQMRAAGWNAELALLAAASFATPALVVLFCPSLFEALTGIALSRSAAATAPAALAAAAAYGATAFAASFATLLGVAERLETESRRPIAARNALAGVLGVGVAAVLAARVLG